MRLAIGIMASASPDVLSATLLYWNHPQCRVYVHVDAKTDVTQFDFLKDCSFADLVSPRVRVSWGGFSQVDAEVAMMQSALKSDFDYFIMISDDTVPLRTVPQLTKELGDQSNWSPYMHTNDPNILKRYTKYWCPDVDATGFRSNSKTFQPSDVISLIELCSLMQQGKFYLDRLFWSSNWKCLPVDHVRMIVKEYKRKDHMLISFKYSINSDEHYIPTTLGRLSDTAGYFRKIMWNDFSRDPKPYVFRLLTELDQPIEEGYLFARKIHSSQLATSVLNRVEDLKKD